MPKGIYKHKPLTEESKKKQSETIKKLLKEGKFKTPNTKGLTYEEIYGVEKAKSIKEKIGINKKGNKFGFQKGHIPPIKGKHWSDEHKKKISESMDGGNSTSFKKGHKIWLGKHHTEETKRKISETTSRVFKGRNVYWIDKILKANHAKPNKCEQYLNQILQENFPNEFKFVGDGSVIIESKSPDFINCNGKKLIIELNGNYWHNLPKVIESDKRKLEIYLKYGYRTLIIWEFELKNKEQLIERIGGFLQ